MTNEQINNIFNIKHGQSLIYVQVTFCKPLGNFNCVLVYDRLPPHILRNFMYDIFLCVYMCILTSNHTTAY